jgi:hypothetical protein
MFERAGGGHLGFYVCEDTAPYNVLGANQRDRVSVSVSVANWAQAERPLSGSSARLMDAPEWVASCYSCALSLARPVAG